MPYDDIFQLLQTWQWWDWLSFGTRAQRSIECRICARVNIVDNIFAGHTIFTACDVNSLQNINTVQCFYNTVNFLPHPNNKHPTASPWGLISDSLSSTVIEVSYVISREIITWLRCFFPGFDRFIPGFDRFIPGFDRFIPASIPVTGTLPPYNQKHI